MGLESGALLGSIVTTIGGLLGVVLSKCRCKYMRNSDNECDPKCSFSDQKLDDHHEIDLFEQRIDDIPSLIISKKHKLIVLYNECTRNQTNPND